MSGFAIICDARKGGSLGIEILALVDRSIRRSQWWTSDEPDIAICYVNLRAAEFAARRLRRNNARVISFESMRRQLALQSNSILDAESFGDIDGDWDSHKDGRSYA